MPLLRPDPTFYPSPTMAMQSPPEKLAYVALINPLKTAAPTRSAWSMSIPTPASYGRLVGQTDMPNAGDELHHFGWNACSSCLCPYAPHPHMERRYLVVPGINSSRIHILDTKPNPRRAEDRESDRSRRRSRSAPATPRRTRCTADPTASIVSALGAPDGNGPGGTFIMDPETFEIRGRWEIDRGPQQLAYDVWWHLGLDTMITSTWGTPNMVKDGVNPELLLAGKYGNTAARLGSAPPAPRAGARSRRRAADGARAAPGARPDSRLRVRRRGALAEGSVVVDLAVVPRRGQNGATDRTASGPSRRSSRFPRSPPTPRSCRRSCRDSRRWRRSSPTSICRSTTGISTSRAGAPASSFSTTSVGSVQAEEGQLDPTLAASSTARRTRASRDSR